MPDARLGGISLEILSFRSEEDAVEQKLRDARPRLLRLLVVVVTALTAACGPPAPEPPRTDAPGVRGVTTEPEARYLS
jgi:hypothetical protein